MDFDRQAAMFYMLVILTIVMGIIAVQIYQLNRDIGPLARSQVARGIAGFGSAL